jgi:hypothetical protein
MCVDKPGTLSAGDVIWNPALNGSRSPRLFLHWNNSLHSFLLSYWCKYAEAHIGNSGTLVWFESLLNADTFKLRVFLAKTLSLLSWQVDGTVWL